MIYYIQHWKHKQEDRFIRCSTPILMEIKNIIKPTYFIGGRCPENSTGSYLEETGKQHFTLKFFCKEHEPNGQ